MAGYPFDLGTYTRPTSTASPTAQAWFDRGLLWSYGFNHEEAVRCFELAVEHDPGYAFAYWGIAYAAGPNYNKDWDAFDAVDLRASLRRAHAAVTSAREAAAGAADVERDLVDALAQRFLGPEPVEDLAPWKLAHAGDVGFYALYRAHDHHFRIYGAMFGAQRQVALDAAGALEAMLNEELLRVEGP